MHFKPVRIFINISIFLGLSFIYSCTSSTWNDAQEADTYESYQAYIADNPEGENLKIARKRADSLYWHDIRTDTSAASFQKYLNDFPDGAYLTEAQQKYNRLSGTSTKGQVKGSNVIIRSDHTTESSSAGVVAKAGTEVEILDRYVTSNSSEAILKRDVTVTANGKRLNVPSGKAVRIQADHSDSVKASFSVKNYGRVEATISKDDIEAMSDQQWYQIRTREGITGWIYGKFIEEM